MYHSKQYNYLGSTTGNITDQSSPNQLWSSGDADCNKNSLPSFNRRFSSSSRMQPYYLHKNYSNNSTEYLGEAIIFYHWIMYSSPKGYHVVS